MITTIAQASELTAAEEAEKERQEAEQVDKLANINIAKIIIRNIIINITRPKPAYGRQGLAGSWGQDTDEVSNFWVFLTSHFSQLEIKPTWDHS